MIRVALPAHLRTLAKLGANDVGLEVEGPVTIDSVLTAIETMYPMLRGTIREHGTKARRPYVRYFACGEDWSFEDTNASLPPAVVAGSEPFLIVGAVAGGRTA